MLVLPKGLLQGERLAKCSDQAQLHFPRLAALTNGFGRIELNLRAITETAYSGFSAPPSREQLGAWLKEYAAAHLLFIYQACDGTPWGQWRGIPENMLPRFKTAADKRSPAPPDDALQHFDEGYASLKKASGDFLNLSSDFGNVPKTSEDSETVQNISADEVVDVVVDEAVDEVVDEGKQIPLPPSAENEKQAPEAAASTRSKRKEGKSRKRTEKPYDPEFLIAFDLYPKHEEKSESEIEWLGAVGRLQHGERDQPAMSRAEAVCFIDSAAQDYRTKMHGRDPQHIRSMRRWLLNSTYLDFEPRTKPIFDEVPASEWLGGATLA